MGLHLGLGRFAQRTGWVMQFIAKRVSGNRTGNGEVLLAVSFPLLDGCSPRAQWFFLCQLTHAGNSQIHTEPKLTSLPVIFVPGKLIMNYHHKGAETTD